MAHYAELDNNNYVIRVIPGIDESQGDGEAIYQQETGNVWKRTSYNTIAGVHKFEGTPFRKNYAGIGYIYDPYRDAFIPPKVFMSWKLNEETCQWEAPVPMPTPPEPHIKYAWDEVHQVWEQINE